MYKLVPKDKPKRDIGIITVIGPELQAVLQTLGRPRRDPADWESEQFQYWLGRINRQPVVDLSYVLTFMAEPRNVPCALAVEHLLSNYEVDCLILVGIAAGPRSKVKLGDVVCADRVYDYEHARLELRKFLGIPSALRISRPRPEYERTEKRIKIAAQQIDIEQLHAIYLERLNELTASDVPADARKKLPKFHTGTIASGDKLIADGSLEKLRRCFDEQIRAGAMEDSGFAQACHLRAKNWCIFRGISDYADPRKGGKWQATAALAAASAAMIFLKTAWRIAPETREEHIVI